MVISQTLMDTFGKLHGAKVGNLMLMEVLSFNRKPVELMIQTARCELITLREDDLDQVVKLYADIDVRQYLGGPVNKQNVRLQFPRMLNFGTKRRNWIVKIVDNNSFAGIGQSGGTSRWCRY